MYSIEETGEWLSQAGHQRRDTVMLHASVRAVREVAGGPDHIHLALKSVLGSEGTLMRYASCARYSDEVGRGNLTREQEREIREKLPAFDPSHGESGPRKRDPGRIPEDLSGRVNRR